MMREWQFTYDGVKYKIYLEDGCISVDHDGWVTTHYEIEAAKKFVRELNNAILSAEGEF